MRVILSVWNETIRTVALLGTITDSFTERINKIQIL